MKKKPGDDPVYGEQTKNDTYQGGPSVAVGKASYRVNGDRKNQCQQHRTENARELPHPKGRDQGGREPEQDD